jgi:hypothetical protein
VCLAGGVGCGKTEVGIVKSVIKSFEEKRSMGVIASNTYTQLQDATLTRFLMRLDEWKIRHKMNWNRMVLKIADNPPILCRSLTNWEKLAGIEIGWYYIDEAWGSPIDGFRELNRRMRCPHAKMLQGFLTTNLNGYDWIYEEFYEKPLEDKNLRSKRGLIRATTLDNPILVKDYIENLSATLTYELLQQWVFAQFVNINAKAAYYNFRRTTHVDAERASFREDLPLRFTMDFNYNPLCGSVGQQAGNTGWTFEEFVLEQASTYDLCDKFITQFRNFRGDVYVYGDATGKRHQTQSKHSDYDIIRNKLRPIFGDRLHLKVPGHNPPIRDRLNSVNMKLKNALSVATYFIHPRCRKTILDFETCETSDMSPSVIEKRGADGEAKTHPTDGVGYWLTYEFPVTKPRYSAL